MLSQRKINVSQKSIKAFFSKNPDIDNAKKVRHIVTEIYNVAIATGYHYSDSNCFNLSEFERNRHQLVQNDDSAQNKLNNMVGLYSVKELIKQQLAFTQLSKLRQKFGFNVKETNGHLVFSGNPGTGKTEVARLYTEILYQNGLILKNKLVEVCRADLVGEYVGQTTPKVKKVFDDASGGVLFIDEAYSLIPQSERDFANETIPAIILEMENRRDDVLVIFAGYKELMHDFIETNPGLRSRILREIYFEDYSNDELYLIFRSMTKNKGYICHPSCKKILLSHFFTIMNKKSMGNVRYVRNLLEISLYCQAVRVTGFDETNLNFKRMNTIMPEDVAAAIKELEEKESKQSLIGFGFHG